MKSYNLAVGSLETRVLVTARKFRDLKAVGGDVLLDPPAPIDVLPREVRAEDLLPAPGVRRPTRDRAPTPARRRAAR